MDDDPSQPPSKPAPEPDSPPRPSSSSTHIAVGNRHSTPEEELYAAAKAMRDAMRGASGSAYSLFAQDTVTTALSSSSLSIGTHSISSSTHSSDHNPTAKTSPHHLNITSTTADANANANDTTNHPQGTTTTTTTTGAPTTTDSPFAFDHDMSRYPASMTSSVRDHVYEGGLRYHAYRAGKYAFPNDEVEQNRDDMKHAMTLMLCRGRYFYAPVEGALEGGGGGGEVLDLGTGTGIWAMELGDKYPKTTVTGIDLSPIQPNFVPENVHFFVDDFEEDWLDPENKYDFIHLRHTLHSVKDPTQLLNRALRHLKPGGYFEAHELCYIPQSDDDTINPATPYALRDFLNYITLGLRVLGSDAHAVLALPDQMRAAGFEGVRCSTHKCPLGAWPRDRRLRFCGLFMRTSIMDGLRGISHRPLTALGWTPLQIEMFLVEVRKACMDESVHAYFNLHVVYGRKPEGGGG